MYNQYVVYCKVTRFWRKQLVKSVFFYNYDSIRVRGFTLHWEIYLSVLEFGLDSWIMNNAFTDWLRPSFPLKTAVWCCVSSLDKNCCFIFVFVKSKKRWSHDSKWQLFYDFMLVKIDVMIIYDVKSKTFACSFSF